MLGINRVVADLTARDNHSRSTSIRKRSMHQEARRPGARSQDARRPGDQETRRRRRVDLARRASG